MGVVYSQNLLAIKRKFFIQIRHFLNNSEIAIERFYIVTSLIKAISVKYFDDIIIIPD